MKHIQNRLKGIATAGALMMAPAAILHAEEGIEIDHLGVNNTLVRTDRHKGYLLLPVQESEDDARINILADGKIAEI